MGNGNRPVVITILGILMILGGLAAIVLGLGTIELGAGASPLLSALGPFGPFLALLGGGALGGIILVVGLLDLATGYGFIKGGMKWSWWIAVILYILGILAGLVMLLIVVGIVPIIIYGLLLYYMTRPGVKSWFGL